MSGEQSTITWQQLPLTPGHTYTDYCSQGQTIEHMVVDIGRTTTFGLSPFNAYVALSQSQGQATIHLLREFDKCIFTQHPSKDMREEDIQLAQLDEETKQQFNCM
jgi:hypothetical protein